MSTDPDHPQDFEGKPIQPSVQMDRRRRWLYFGLYLYIGAAVSFAADWLVGLPEKAYLQAVLIALIIVAAWFFGGLHEFARASQATDNSGER
jgi:hypothetical protein